MQSPRHGTRQAARDIEPRRVGEQGYLPEGEGDNHRRYGRGGTKEDDEDEDDGKGGMAENMDESIAKRLIMAGELPSFRFHPQVYLRSDFVTYRLNFPGRALRVEKSLNDDKPPERMINFVSYEQL